MMMTIKIFGTTPPCAKCKRAEREALKAAEEFSGQVEVQKLDALGPEAEAYGMMVTPTVVVGDEVVGSGQIVPADRLVAHIRNALGG
jgi:protein-disulfide isomerase